MPLRTLENEINSWSGILGITFSAGRDGVLCPPGGGLTLLARAYYKNPVGSRVKPVSLHSTTPSVVEPSFLTIERKATWKIRALPTGDVTWEIIDDVKHFRRSYAISFWIAPRCPLKMYDKSPDCHPPLLQRNLISLSRTILLPRKRSFIYLIWISHTLAMTKEPSST